MWAVSAAGFRLIWRAQYFGVLLGFALVLVLAALMSAQFSARQPATVALDVGISVVRVLLPFLVALQAQELIAKEFDRRLYLSTFAYPASRTLWLMGRFSVILCSAWLALAFLMSILAILVSWVSEWYGQATPVSVGWPLFVVASMQALDLLVVVSVALFLGVVASTPSFVMLGVLGFVLIARSFAAVVALLGDSPWVVGDVGDEYRGGLNLLSYFLPDLGGLDVRAVALYGRVDLLSVDVVWVALGCLSYSVLFLVLSCSAIQRKIVA